MFIYCYPLPASDRIVTWPQIKHSTSFTEEKVAFWVWAVSWWHLMQLDNWTGNVNIQSGWFKKQNKTKVGATALTTVERKWYKTKKHFESACFLIFYKSQMFSAVPFYNDICCPLTAVKSLIWYLGVVWIILTAEVFLIPWWCHSGCSHGIHPSVEERLPRICLLFNFVSCLCSV